MELVMQRNGWLKSDVQASIPRQIVFVVVGLKNWTDEM